MSRLTKSQRLLAGLKEEISEDSLAFLSKENAYRLLKKYTKQDFGYDADRWRDWIEQNGLPELGIPSDTEFDNAIDAALEFEDQKHPEKVCLRCGGRLVITIQGNSYHIQCENKDFTLDWTPP